MPKWVECFLYILICGLIPVVLIDTSFFRYLLFLYLLIAPPILTSPNLSSNLYRLVFLPRFTVEDFLKFESLPNFILVDIHKDLENKLKPSRLRVLKRDLRIFRYVTNIYGTAPFKVPFKKVPLHIPSTTGVFEWRLRVGK